MKHLFVPYEIAKQLAEKGFNESCFKINESDDSLMHMHSFDIRLSYLPLYQQVIDWFREKHKLEIDVTHFNDNRFNWSYQIKNITNVPAESRIIKSNPFYNQYYDALNDAIEEALKLI